MKNFKAGDLIVQIKPEGCEIGKIKRIKEDGNYGLAWFHDSDTAALVNLDFIFPVLNDYCLKEILQKGIIMDKQKFREEVEKLYQTFDREDEEHQVNEVLERGLIDSFDLQFVNLFQDQLERLQDLVDEYLISDNLESLEEKKDEQNF